jgi:hypothetical protein
MPHLGSQNSCNTINPWNGKAGFPNLTQQLPIGADLPRHRPISHHPVDYGPRLLFERPLGSYQRRQRTHRLVSLAPPRLVRITAAPASGRRLALPLQASSRDVNELATETQRAQWVDLNRSNCLGAEINGQGNRLAVVHNDNTLS